MSRQLSAIVSSSSLATLGLVLGLASLTSSGCGDPCLDDGPPKGECKNVAGSGSETASTSADATADASADGTASGESGTASNTGDGDGDATGDGDGDSGDGDGDATAGDGDGDTTGDGDGDDPCANGMQDPGETDIDCGGECVEINPDNPNDIEGQCGEGDDCFEFIDCWAGECTEAGICNICPDNGEFVPQELGYNDCQSCLLTNCCDAVIECFMNIEKCVCWFNCVENTGQTQICMDTCGNGNIGSINSCMNNSCKADNNSLNCAAP